MLAFTIEDLKKVVDAINQLNSIGDIGCLKNLTPIQLMILDELQKIK